MVTPDLSLNYTPVKVSAMEIQKIQQTTPHPPTLIKKKNRRFKKCYCGRKCGIVALTLVALTAGIGAFIVWKTGFVDSMITNQLVIINDTKVFEMWSRPPVHPLHYIYLFNYTNIEDFEAERADKLKVEEIGPYVYRYAHIRHIGASAAKPRTGALPQC
jgi:hypothetical protein